MRPGTVEHALAVMEQLAQKNAALERARREPVAIVGMACRFPGGADTPAAFWALLKEGREAVRPLEGRWAWLGVPPPLEAPGRCCGSASLRSCLSLAMASFNRFLARLFMD